MSLKSVTILILCLFLTLGESENQVSFSMMSGLRFPSQINPVRDKISQCRDSNFTQKISGEITLSASNFKF